MTSSDQAIIRERRAQIGDRVRIEHGEHAGEVGEITGGVPGTAWTDVLLTEGRRFALEVTVSSHDLRHVPAHS